jgi:hypothetical protein
MMTGLRRFCAALAAIAVGGILTPGPASAEQASGGRAPRITVTDIVAPGRVLQSYPGTEIDQRGGVLVEAVGSDGASSGYGIWRRGAFEMIQPPGGSPPSGVTDLSSRGHAAVGVTNRPPCDGPVDPYPLCPRPQLWTRGRSALLPTDGLPGTASIVNDRGSIVTGTLRRYVPEERRFVHELVGWVDGELVRGPIGADDDVVAMNDRGQALIVVPVGGTWHGAVWQVGGEVTDVGLPVGLNGEVVDINERGEVVGWQGPSAPLPWGGYLWRAGELVELGPMEPVDVNDRGQVLGECLDPTVTLVTV